MTLHTLVGAWALALWCVPGAAMASDAVAQAAPTRPASSAASQKAPPAGTADAGAYNQFMVGRYLESEGDVQGAIKAYTEATRLDPKSAELRAELASLYARGNQFEEAMKNARLALGNDRDNVTAHRVLGILYASLARADEGSGPLDAEAAGHAAQAIEHLDAARRHAEAADAGLDMMLAQIYLRTGEYDKAAALFSRVANDERGPPRAGHAVGAGLRTRRQDRRGDQGAGTGGRRPAAVLSDARRVLRTPAAVGGRGLRV